MVIREGCFGEVQNANTFAFQSNEHGADVRDIADSTRFDVDGDFSSGISLHDRHSIGPQRLNLREVSHGPQLCEADLARYVQTGSQAKLAATDVSDMQLKQPNARLPMADPALCCLPRPSGLRLPTVLSIARKVR